jgi:hypothetical protein
MAALVAGLVPAPLPTFSLRALHGHDRGEGKAKRRGGWKDTDATGGFSVAAHVGDRSRKT